ncbi:MULTISPECIES: RloB family protein [unclassified Saccharothrix]|uniref:RloB family protein n=1 Tax=unclassified Saccharothrix TaxID=2593673 RepID=UPI00307F1FFE
MARRTTGKDLRRRTGTRPERRTILIFCEGVASEPDYINGLKRLPEVRGNTAISIEVDPHPGVPFRLVTAAIERAADPEIDECWCVFDVEYPQRHPRLGEAISLATKHGIRVAVSNPCFELWLILHFENQTAHLSTDQAERRSRQLDGRSGKHIEADLYMPRRHEAARRAAALAERHARNGVSSPDDNPSSTIYELLAAIERPPG